MKTYKEGLLKTSADHIAYIGEYLFSLDSKKKYFIKVMEEDELRTTEQNSTFWKVLSITKRLGTITKINSKGGI